MQLYRQGETGASLQNQTKKFSSNSGIMRNYCLRTSEQGNSRSFAAADAEHEETNGLLKNAPNGSPAITAPGSVFSLVELSARREASIRRVRSNKRVALAGMRERALIDSALHLPVVGKCGLPTLGDIFRRHDGVRAYAAKNVLQ